MLPNALSMRGIFLFSKSNLFSSKFSSQISPQPSSKLISGNVSRLSLAATVSLAYDELPEQETEGNTKGIDISHQMGERGVRANCQTYLWLLDGCLHSGSLLDAWKLHGQILKLGFCAERILCDRLIDLYIVYDDFSGLVKVFDDMPYRVVSCWNKIINGFIAKELTSQVPGIFRKMVEENVNPDEKTLSGVLKACGGNNVPFNYVEQLHARMIIYGFETSSFVCNHLIDLYSRSGFVNSAKKVFGNLYLRDSASWVAMISGLSQNGYEEEAILLFCQMHTSGIFLTPYMFSSVLSACTKVKLFEFGKQLHGLVFKQGFSSETYVCNSLMTLYSRLGSFISAEQIFSAMLHRDGVSCNSMISGLAQQGFSDKALEFFKKMHLEWLKPDFVTIASVLSACASVGALLKGKQLHSYAIKAGMSSDLILEGSLLDLYVKCSDIESAHDFFITTETENVVLWNMMLVCHGQLDNLNESLQIFRQMQVEGIVPNQFTYPSILRTCTSVGALDLGEQIHTQIVKTGFQFNVYVSSVLIDMYAKLGKLDTALEILRRLKKDDLVSWTAMIAGYAQHGMFTEALTLFEEMQDRAIQSDNIGFSSAISACAGIQALDQGRQIHAQSCVSGYLNDLSIGNALVSLYARCGKVSEAYLAFKKIFAKDNVSWNSLLSGFAHSGHCEEALNVFARMNKAGVELNLFTFGSAVSAAANIADLKLGKQIHAMIKKTGYDSEAEASNVLITLYAKCGSIDDARRKFYEMPEKNEHPLADKIYKYLGELNEGATVSGYVQCSNNLLNDKERGYKDPRQMIHSEKLAISFGLLSLSSSNPVRVFKNLRVCGDCHNWIKYVSKISDRAIIVRDAHRFHHFEGGVCSCKDYW
ncbi:hypothetical protein L6164_031855 [Bauhinia variegata]|uniref:Uncharacterized protein n=1 Tax=Bauhinia variegata TaxID=167791 RepID=A0ACB9KLY3_BAUVA|nr:hypothetical protein L6164_031855 [Bauhinia variegata]